MKEYIERPLYINRIRPYIGKSLIKVLTGQRRVGKSCLLMQIRDLIQTKAPDTQIIYIILSCSGENRQELPKHDTLISRLPAFDKTLAGEARLKFS